jgi:KaiC/GvpD/RAD55 family RecA-like ATPase
MVPFARVSTGIKGFDDVLGYLHIGDNVVLQVDGIDDYQKMMLPFVKKATQNNRRVVYMRFARHEPLLEAKGNIIIYKLNAEKGFESFSTQVHNIIRQEGRNVFYVFDSLSDLLFAWATDLMIGNFFMVTCTYLYELDTVAYFAVLRGRHSFKTIARIRETTQVLVDVYDYQGRICIHPLKAQHRYSPNMYLPHIMEKERFVPIMNSIDAAQLFSFLVQKSSVSPERHLDYWDRIFLKAKELLEGPSSQHEKTDMVEQLARILIGREKRMISLVKEYFNLDDILSIKSRLIGTGFIGGKSVGMLLARNILRSDASMDWSSRLEVHDSFYIGSDVFYSYIVQNGWWKLLMAHKTREGYFKYAEQLRNQMLHGTFPEEVKEQFQLMLEYFGQSPIIVRSSSLLEDAFGNAFAGKYESFFCVNQGTPEQRYVALEDSVRHIFATTLNVDALTYRQQRGLDQQDEQMALLVQRVSGSRRKQYFFPEVAGVGLSYNTFVWKQGMDLRAGMLRVVFGLGTRAVNRVENDYPRIVALDDPLVKPHTSVKDSRRFSQHDVDVLNLEDGLFQSIPLTEVIKKKLATHLHLLCAKDMEASERTSSRGRHQDIWILTFDELLNKTDFVQIMSRMLKTLERVYQYPVDIEFTMNFLPEGPPQINLLQCRPFQTKGQNVRVQMPDMVSPDLILLHQEGNFMGGSVSRSLCRIIYVDPEGYKELPLSEKYAIARLVGRLNKLIDNRNEMPTALFGPGRWGTTTPAMGVPVTFSEINNIVVIAEIAYKHGSLVPELSFGTHFFQDLVEMDIFYMAIYPEKENVVFNSRLLKSFVNILSELSPQDSRYSEVVSVCDVTEKGLKLMSDVINQKVICFQDKE